YDQVRPRSAQNGPGRSSRDRRMVTATEFELRSGFEAVFACVETFELCATRPLERDRSTIDRCDDWKVLDRFRFSGNGGLWFRWFCLVVSAELIDDRHPQADLEPAPDFQLDRRVLPFQTSLPDGHQEPDTPFAFPNLGDGTWLKNCQAHVGLQANFVASGFHHRATSLYVDAFLLRVWSRT